MNAPIFCGQTINQETMDFYSCRIFDGEATFNLKYDDWDNECPNSLDPTYRCGLRIDARTYAKALQNRAKANIELHKTNIKIYLHQTVGVEEN